LPAKFALRFAELTDNLMELPIVLAFVLGYVAIVLEHPLRVNKAATSLLTGGVCWLLYAIGHSAECGHGVSDALMHHLADIAAILFFLLGAMTIVELIDAYHGFRVITDLLNSRHTGKLLLWVGLATFFLSAILDNLTTSIVMGSILRVLVPDQKLQLRFAGMVIIAANAGGAWTPIGDVTTTMLWIGGQVSTGAILQSLFLPSLVCFGVSYAVLMIGIPRKLETQTSHLTDRHVPQRGSRRVFGLGVLGLLSVPVLKATTGLPPFMAILLALGALWVLTEWLHRHTAEDTKTPLSVRYALQRVDTPSVLFFFGILAAVSCLQSLGVLQQAANWLNHTLGNLDLMVVLIGVLSSVVDNVPLVAAAQGMYSLSEYPMDHRLWELMALCAGAGGSLLVIGSAAGVAVMGILQIEFFEYIKRVSLAALAGYGAGIATYIFFS
jgi:Na+/H+ antiporter NhaD/arsenite permease-like protein